MLTIAKRKKSLTEMVNKVREKMDIGGIITEKFFNPEFKEVMDHLREKDESIRSLVSGDSDDGEAQASLKNLLKTADSYLNRREYMSAIGNLGRFHHRVGAVVKEIESLNLNLDAVYNAFLFKDLDDDQRKYLQDLKTRFATDQSVVIKKEAGFFSNIKDYFYRNRALAIWEKRFPKQISKLKKDTRNLYNKSEALLEVINVALGEMDKSRAQRKIEEYVKSTTKITKSYQNYNAFFNQFYQENVKGFLDKIDFTAPPVKVDNSKEVRVDDWTKTTPAGAPVFDEPAAESVEPPTPAPVAVPAPAKAPVVPPLPPALAPPTVNDTVRSPHLVPEQPVSPTKTDGSDTVRSPNIFFEEETQSGQPVSSQEVVTEKEFKSDQLAKEFWGKTSHVKFIQSLESMSSEDPRLVASYIKKYAKLIKKTDPVVSANLLQLMRNLEG